MWKRGGVLPLFPNKKVLIDKISLAEILEKIEAFSFVVDVDTFHILYANPALKQKLRENLEDELCYRVLRGREQPCPSCKNQLLFSSDNPSRTYFWRTYNPVLKAYFRLIDFGFEFNGQRLKLEIAFDVTQEETLERALHDLTHLFLSLHGDYSENVNQVLSFARKLWNVKAVALKDSQEQIFLSACPEHEKELKELEKILRNPPEFSLHRRLLRGEKEIILLKSGKNGILAILGKRDNHFAKLRRTMFLILRLLRQEEERERTRKRFHTLVEHNPDAIFIVNQKGEILFTNQKARNLLAQASNRQKNPTIISLLDPVTWETLQAHASEDQIFGCEVTIAPAPEKILPFEANISILENLDAPSYFLSLRDIRERKEYERALLELAFRDQLTGAYNRHFFEEYMQKELSRCKREQYPLSITMIDVDRFKEINDLYGHTFGDEVLRMVVYTIRGNVRASDVVVRYGGDEFIVVLPHASLQDAQAVMQRIKEKLQGSQIMGEPFPLSISYGVCVFDGQKDLPQLLQEIDRAMYNMKREGKR